MSTRYDVLTGRDYKDANGDKKTSWTRVGAAWRKGDAEWGIQLDALPINGRLIIKPPREQPFNPKKGRQPEGAAKGMPEWKDVPDAAPPAEEDIPF